MSLGKPRWEMALPGPMAPRPGDLDMAIPMTKYPFTQTSLTLTCSPGFRKGFHWNGPGEVIIHAGHRASDGATLTSFMLLPTTHLIALEASLINSLVPHLSVSLGPQRRNFSNTEQLSGVSSLFPSCGIELQSSGLVAGSFTL